MNRNELLQISGEKLECVVGCPFEFNCFAKWLNEEERCEAGIHTLKKRFDDLGLVNLLMTQNFFGLRVFKSTSALRPLPVIGTLLIDKGKLLLRDE